MKVMVKGIVVSNHGGRAEESGRGTIDNLPEIARMVRGRDRGPYLWGLGAFGQPGVERVLQILRAELRTTMIVTRLVPARREDQPDQRD